MNGDFFPYVSEKRCCRICGGASLCRFSNCENLSLCVRQRTNADFEAENSRWGIFCHLPKWKVSPPKFFKELLKNPPPVGADKATLDIRHFAYQTLLELAPATAFNELIEGEQGLAKRGITKVENYGGLPPSKRRRRIAREICERLKAKFPDFFKDGDLWQMLRIPGFWIDDKQRPNFWYPKSYNHPALLIPFRSPEGKIKALQMRFFVSHVSDANRYHWLSARKLLSVPADAAIHFADWQENSPLEKPLLITEGALKADAVEAFQQNNLISGKKYTVIGNSGISAAHDEIVLAAFDCGDERKNKFLKNFALQNSKGGLGRTFVAVKPDDETGKVFGYYTISSSAVKFESLPPAKHLPRYPLPAILIGKLAIDKTAQKQGLGTALLFDALKRSTKVAEEIGVFLIEIKAVNETAKNLYVKIGFLEMLDEPLKLYLSIKKVRQLLVESENKEG